MTARLPRLGVAAVGPVMLKVAAEESDDVKLHSFCTRKYLEQNIMPILDAGLAARGRSRESFEISGGGFVVTGKDDAAVGQAVRLGALSRGLLRLDAGLLAGVRDPWPG